MTRKTSHRARYLKPAACAIVSLFIGITLIVLSRKVAGTEPTTKPTTTTQPSAPTPDDTPQPTHQSAAQSFSGLLLMFGLTALLIAAISLGWIIHIHQKTKPAWKKQTKYPKHH